MAFFEIKADFTALDAAVHEAMDGGPRLPVRVTVTREQPNSGKCIYRMMHPAHGDLGAIAIRKGVAFCEIEVTEPERPPRREFTEDELTAFRAAPRGPARDGILEQMADAVWAEQDAGHNERLALLDQNVRAVFERLSHDPMLRAADTKDKKLLIKKRPGAQPDDLYDHYAAEIRGNGISGRPRPYDAVCRDWKRDREKAGNLPKDWRRAFKHAMAWRLLPSGNDST
jgi:hypothetical protein